MATRTYKITYTAQAHATAVVRASSLDEARTIAEERIERNPGMWSVTSDWDLWTETVKYEGEWVSAHEDDA